MLKLVMTARDAEQLIQMCGHAASSMARADLFMAASRDATELLVRSPFPGSTAIPPNGNLYVWQQARVDAPLPEPAAAALAGEERLAVGLAIGSGPLAGLVMAKIRIDGALRAIDTIQVVGPGMPRDSLTGNSERYARGEWISANGVYSRAVGNIGLKTLTQLQQSRIAVVGAGSNGSHTAMALARMMGPGASLLLIDEDDLEAYNLQAWGAPVSSRDRLCRHGPKVLELAEAVRGIPDPPRVETCVGPIDSWDGHSLIRTADIIVSCVDSPAGRLAAMLLGAALIRPVLDIATGAFIGRNAEEHRATVAQKESSRQAEYTGSVPENWLPDSLTAAGPRMRIGDVRLIVPDTQEGSGSCLLCNGGVGDLAADAGGNGTGSAPFWMGRSGSHLPTNASVTATGVDLLMAFLAGLVAGTEHWQLDWSFGLPPVWRTVPGRPVENCPVCAIAGTGDVGISRMERVGAQLKQ